MGETRRFSGNISTTRGTIPNAHRGILANRMGPATTRVTSITHTPPRRHPTLITRVYGPGSRGGTTVAEAAPPPTTGPLSSSDASRRRSASRRLIRAPTPRRRAFPREIGRPLGVSHRRVLRVTGDHCMPGQLTSNATVLYRMSKTTGDVVHH